MACLYYPLSLFLLILFFLFNVFFTRSILQPNLNTKNPKNNPKKVIVYLGSGGHTGEMLKILGTYKNTIKEAQIAVLYSENNSLLRFKNQFSQLNKVQYHAIGKARQVNAGKISSILSILTTFLSIIALFVKEKSFFLFNHKNTLLLVNGPGTCVLLCTLFQALKVVSLSTYSNFKIVYIESLARCNNLSMTGLLIYYLKLSDEFIVQWQEMCEKYKDSKYYGILV